MFLVGWILFPQPLCRTCRAAWRIIARVPDARRRSREHRRQVPVRSRVRSATVVTVTLLLSCKALPAARQASNAEVSHTAATVAAPAPAESKHSPDIAMMRCFEREGDPRGWPAQAPSEGDSWDMQARYSYCPWTVTLEEGKVHAEARWWPSTAEPVFTGPAHMFTDDGRATVVEFDAGSFQVARSLDVLGAPRAILVESEESILVATSRRIVRVVEAKTVEWVYTSAEGFEPTSLVKDADGTLYLGAQYFVVKLTPMRGGFHESWLAPPGAVRSRESPYVY